MGHPAIINELVVDLEQQTWKVQKVTDASLIGPVQYGWDRFKQDPQSMTFGGGLLAGSPVPGTRRMIFCGYSPAWEDFYVSALGGAMYVFHRTGVNFCWLRGQSRQNVVLVMRYVGGEYSIQFEPLDPEPVWKGYPGPDGTTLEGFYALQQCLFERYASQFPPDGLRILTLGPASRLTLEGAIGSSQVKKGALSRIDDWAGRGGLGSRLLQYHGVVGIVYGGDYQDPELKEARELDQYFLEHFGQRTIASDLALSQKYRYVPKFETGGTFGVNMHEAEDRLFSFNYRSIYASDDERLEQHQRFVVDHYLKQFNEEIIAPKNFDHCGEPCAVACKKFLGEYKKDYEPYAILGPNSGIFDQRAAERLNKLVDTVGADAISLGGMVSWLMELFGEGLLQAQDFGLTPDLPGFHFSADPAVFDPVQRSAQNAEFGMAVVRMILFSEAGVPFRRGLRAAARWVDERYGIDSMARAVYNAHGENGCMVPNQYWCPGVFSPMPLMGKYFQFYGIEFYPPYDLGRKNVERFVYELYSENSGSCRFHRKWVEDIIDEIILSHYELDLDYWGSNFALAKEIHDHQSSRAVFWESERTIDIIHGYLEKWQRIGLKDPALLDWVARFQADKNKAAREFWQALVDGMSDAFRQGFGEPQHVEHGFLPGKA